MITQENIPYTADEIKAMVKTCEKYNKAREKARELMDKGYDVLMPEIFPELNESEDERIRKAIIAYINHGQHCGVSNADMLAWLEKQDEKKRIKAGKPIRTVRELMEELRSLPPDAKLFLFDSIDAYRPSSVEFVRHLLKNTKYDTDEFNNSIVID